MADLAKNRTGSEFYGWRLLAVFSVISLINLGFPNYGSGVINSYMAVDLHLDRKMLGLLFSVYMLMSGLPGPLVALSINRKGIRFTLVAGSLFVLAGAIAMALFVSSGLQALIAFGFIVGTGVITGSTMTSQAGVARWFVKRRALALSILYASNGIGGFIAAPLLDRIISAGGGNWRLGWWLIVALACTSTAVAAFFVKERPSDLGQLPDGSEKAQQAAVGKNAKTGRFGVHVTAEEWTYREALKSPVLWMMLVGQLGTSSAYSLFLGHGVIHLRDLGHAPAAAAMSVSILTLFSLLAKAIVGTLGDRLDPRYIWAAAVASSGMSMILLVNARGAAALYPFAICLGLGFGGAVVSMMAVLSNYYGSAVFASITGLSIAIQTTVSAIVPYCAGYLFDLYGTYSMAFYILAIWCFAGTILLLLVRQPVRTMARL